MLHQCLAETEGVLFPFEVPAQTDDTCPYKFLWNQISSLAWKNEAKVCFAPLVIKDTVPACRLDGHIFQSSHAILDLLEPGKPLICIQQNNCGPLTEKG